MALKAVGRVNAPEFGPYLLRVVTTVTGFLATLGMVISIGGFFALWKNEKLKKAWGRWWGPAQLLISSLVLLAGFQLAREQASSCEHALAAARDSTRQEEKSVQIAMARLDSIGSSRKTREQLESDARWRAENPPRVSCSIESNNQGQGDSLIVVSAGTPISGLRVETLTFFEALPCRETNQPKAQLRYLLGDYFSKRAGGDDLGEPGRWAYGSNAQLVQVLTSGMVEALSSQNMHWGFIEPLFGVRITFTNLIGDPYERFYSTDPLGWRLNQVSKHRWSQLRSYADSLRRERLVLGSGLPVQQLKLRVGHDAVAAVLSLERSGAPSK